MSEENEATKQKRNIEETYEVNSSSLIDAALVIDSGGLLLPPPLPDPGSAPLDPAVNAFAPPPAPPPPCLPNLKICTVPLIELTHTSELTRLKLMLQI
jgi:hypothetical protein